MRVLASRNLSLQLAVSPHQVKGMFASSTTTSALFRLTGRVTIWQQCSTWLDYALSIRLPLPAPQLLDLCNAGT